jgi:hypothetical protein
MPFDSSPLGVSRLSTEVEGGEHVLDRGVELGGGELEALAEEAQVLGRRHVLVERVAVAQEADLAAQGGLVGAGGRTPSKHAALGRGASTVASMRSVVDLPAPLGPMRPSTSPRCTASCSPVTASRTPSYEWRMSLHWTCCMNGLPGARAPRRPAWDARAAKKVPRGVAWARR